VRGGFGSVALAVAALTLTSRIIGFGRSVVFSKTVGDTCLGDVYHAANTLPNVAFEIVAGGVLAGVVVPVLARHLSGDRKEAAAQTASALITWTLLILTPAAVAAFALARLYAQAFAKPACVGSASIIAGLLIMFVPQIWLYGLAVVTAGILQAQHRFLASAAGPLFSSAVVITAYVIFATGADPAGRRDVAELSETSVAVLGWGTTLGVLALTLTTAIPALGSGLRLRPRLRFATGDRSVIIRIAAAGVAGLIMQQLSVVLIIWSAQRGGDPGALTRFTWANAIYLLPYAVLVAPLLQMIFPRLSAAAGTGAVELRAVLTEISGPVTVLAGLGAALLGATAFPVARIFVLGPGSGRTAALAWPIIAFAPAVIGFALLGLASRTLLAQRQARSAGLATVSAWGVVILAVLALRPVVPAGWLVPTLGASVSLGMIAGAAVGWVLLGRVVRPRLAKTLSVALVAAAASGTLVGWFAEGLARVSLAVAVGGAVVATLACIVVFGGVVLVADRAALMQVWDLRRGIRNGSAGP